MSTFRKWLSRAEAVAQIATERNIKMRAFLDKIAAAGLENDFNEYNESISKSAEQIYTDRERDANIAAGLCPDCGERHGSGDADCDDTITH